jgi:ABC-type uncharacterized transport system substrate-binding protein
MIIEMTRAVTIRRMPWRPARARVQRRQETKEAARPPSVVCHLFHKEYVAQGGLMFYGADFADLFRCSAVYVHKSLKGAKPADFPVQQATKFEFVINLKAAKQIGLSIPVRVLERAIK